MIAWFANPLLLLAWIFACFSSRGRSALTCGLIALGVSVSYLIHREILIYEPGGGRYVNVTGYGPGYWLWVTSILLAIAAAVFVDKQTAPKTPEQIASGDQELARRLGEFEGK